MAEFIWSWTKGNYKVFTRCADRAQEAQSEGLMVMTQRVRPHIYRH